jgi:hypothetical protein
MDPQSGRVQVPFGRTMSEQTAGSLRHEGGLRLTRIPRRRKLDRTRKERQRRAAFRSPAFCRIIWLLTQTDDVTKC